MCMEDITIGRESNNLFQPVVLAPATSILITGDARRTRLIISGSNDKIAVSDNMFNCGLFAGSTSDFTKLICWLGPIPNPAILRIEDFGNVLTGNLFLTNNSVVAEVYFMQVFLDRFRTPLPR